MRFRIIAPLPFNSISMPLYCYQAKKNFEEYKMKVQKLMEKSLEVIKL